MGRRRHSDSEETFDTIVAAARVVLRRDGASDFSLRRVAAEAGLRLSSVQYYFRSKDQLVASCLEADAEDFRRELDLLRQAVRAGGALEEVLGSAVQAFFLRRHADPEAMRLRVMSASQLQGDVSPVHPGPFLISEMNDLSELVAELAPMPLRQARLRIHSVASLFGRYIRHEPDVLRGLLQLDDDEDVVDVVAQHLGDVTRALLRPA